MPEIHRFAAIFPKMSEEELKDLAADIKANGLRQRISIYGGRIIDGRNRYQACLLANVAPYYEEKKFASDDEAARYVVSCNLLRRHLTDAQRTMMAAEMEPLMAVKAKERMSNGGKNKGVANLPHPKSRDEVAKMFKVSPRGVQNAKAVISRGIPELPDSVKKGEMPMSVALSIAKLPKEEQLGSIRKIKALGKKRKRPELEFPPPIDADEVAIRRSSESVKRRAALIRGLFRSMSVEEREEFLSWVRSDFAKESA